MASADNHNRVDVVDNRLVIWRSNPVYAEGDLQCGAILSRLNYLLAKYQSDCNGIGEFVKDPRRHTLDYPLIYEGHIQHLKPGILVQTADWAFHRLPEITAFEDTNIYGKTKQKTQVNLFNACAKAIHACHVKFGRMNDHVDTENFSQNCFDSSVYARRRSFEQLTKEDVGYERCSFYRRSSNGVETGHEYDELLHELSIFENLNAENAVQPHLRPRYWMIDKLPIYEGSMQQLKPGMKIHSGGYEYHLPDITAFDDTGEDGKIQQQTQLKIFNAAAKKIQDRFLLFRGL